MFRHNLPALEQNACDPTSRTDPAGRRVQTIERDSDIRHLAAELATVRRSELNLCNDLKATTDLDTNGGETNSGEAELIYVGRIGPTDAAIEACRVSCRSEMMLSVRIIGWPEIRLGILRIASP